MKELLLILPWAIVLFYSISFWRYLSYFKQKREQVERSIHLWVLLSVVFHTAYLTLLGIRLGHIPVGDVYQVLTTCSWLFMLVYLVQEIRLKEITMGLFFVPIVLTLHLISSIFIDVDKPLAPVLHGALFEIHVVIMISGYAAFAISFISSVMYILLSREIQTKKLGIFFERLPNLEFFDKLSNHAINIGLVLVGLGFGLGFYLGMTVWEGWWTLDPKLLSVLISWGIYFAHFITRKTVGWQGRRAAVVSVIGFNWLLFSFIIVNIFLSKFHSFH